MKREQKKALITDHQKHKKDTGSFFVQIAVFSERINGLTEHLKMHPKDKHSRHGLLQMVSKRRKLLTHLKKKALDKYKDLVEKLGIRA
jgi:small subunit ribosomal protein S15